MRIHFIGIGGIGVSALAQYYLKKGHEVSGCDLVRSEITDQLKNIGVHIRIGTPNPACSARAEKIVHSPAVQKSNVEIKNLKLEIPILSYPQALGELTKKYYTIAIAGTHGKSTTTAMIGLLLERAGLDPTVIVGTKIKEFHNSNCRVGKSKYLVIEADEHFASFLNYRPSMIALTNVEEDHLDYYKNLKNIIAAFKKYVSFLPKDGVLIANEDDPNIKKIVGKKKTSWYSLEQKEASRIRKVLKVPGEHNVANALAAFTAARVLGIDDKVSLKSLSEYRGSWRRFEIFDLKIKNLKFKIVSDYGHHPTEIKVTVEAARQKWPKKKIWLVFQPHQYQRTHYLWKDFVKVLSSLPVQKLILTDIYDVAGREEGGIRKKVSSEKLVREIKNLKLEMRNYPVLYIPTLKEAETYIRKNLRGGEVVMVMGAGDIYNLVLALTLDKRGLTRKGKREKI